jgi:hypothetical protein
VQRTPISEQCRGVVTTLTLLGLGELVERRDIKAIRAWFASQDPEAYTDLVMKLAGIKYVVMTNIPFDAQETAKWKVPLLPLPCAFGAAAVGGWPLSQLGTGARCVVCGVRPASSSRASSRRRCGWTRS